MRDSENHRKLVDQKLYCVGLMLIILLIIIISAVFDVIGKGDNFSTNSQVF